MVYRSRRWAILGHDRPRPCFDNAKGNYCGHKPIPNYTRHERAASDAYIFTEERDTLFEEFSLAGVTFRQSIRDDGDRLRGFEVMDADGYVLFFGRRNG